jgi:hypothetical protein
MRQEKLVLINEDISRAAGLFRSSPNLGDEGIFGTLVKQGIERELAARLVEFLPLAYCRLILRNSGAHFSETFRRALPGSGSQEKPLSSEPVWRAVVTFASTEVERGVSGNDLLLVAARSAEFHAANQLLDKGSKLENLAFAPPVFTWPEEGPNVSTSDGTTRVQ